MVACHRDGRCRWRCRPVGVDGARRLLGIRHPLSVASTVVLLKALEAKGAVDTVNGRIAVGWLVVEDLAMVLVLVLLPALAPMGPARRPADARPNRWIWGTLARTLLRWRPSSR